MSYRKFNADQLFTGYAMLGSESVLITDESGTVQDIILINEAGESIEKFNGILSPGFINCHCHLELSHMHGAVPRSTGMIKFLLQILNERNGEDAHITEAILMAEAYMKERGIVAVGDVCNTAHSLNVKSKGNLYYHNFVEATGFTEANAEMRFNQAVELYSKFAGLNGRTSIVPHSPYSVSDNLFRLINNHIKGSLLTIHNQESVAETEFFSTGKGELLELYEKLGIDIAHFTPSNQSSLIRSIIKITGDHTVILVHNVNTTSEDMETIRRGRNLPKLYWCLCPNANLYINEQLPDVPLFRNFNCKLVIGTDSLASNSQLNILEEIKTIQDNYPSLTTTELLRWATVNGAEALRIEDRFGSFEKGKKPGVVNIDGGNNGTLAGSVAKRVL